MQINIVAGHLGGQGGTERVIVDFANGMSQRGFKVNLFLLMDEVSDDRWLLQLNPGVVVAQLPARHKFQKLHTLATLSRCLVGLVLVVNTRNIQTLTHFRKIFKRSYIVVSWIHSNIKGGYKALKLADYHLAISQGIQKQLEGLGIAPQRIFTVLDPVPRQSNTILKSQAPGPVQLLYIGRLENKAKNVRGLLDICAGLTGAFQVAIYGDGPDRVALQKYAQKKGLAAHLTWHGQVQDPWRHIKAADALLLTSNFEGLSLVLLEAMSFGVPCVAYDCPVGPGEVIQPGQNGYLIPMGAVTQFQEQVQTFIDRRPQFADQQAIKHSIDRFYRPAYFQRLEHIFHDMTGGDDRYG